MANLEELMNNVKLALQEEDVSDDLIIARINEGLIHCTRKVALPDLESTGEFDTEVGIDEVDIPEAWNYQRRLYAAEDAENTPLEVASSIGVLRSKYPMNSLDMEEGDVKVLTIRKGKIVYYPVPSEVTTIRCKFYEKPTPLVKETDIPDCIPEDEQNTLLESFALWKLWAVIEDGITGAKVNTAYYKNEFKEAFNEIDDDTDEGQSSPEPLRDNSWI